MAICSTFISPLDLECLFLNYFAGAVSILLFVALFVIVYTGARFKFTVMSIIVSWFVFLLMFYKTFEQAAYITAVLAAVFIALAIKQISGK